MIYEDSYAVFLIMNRAGWKCFLGRIEQEFNCSRFRFAVDKVRRVHKIQVYESEKVCM